MACADTVVLHGGPNGAVTLKEALCVPTMHMNLLSGGYVTDKGGSYHGKGLHLTVHGLDDRVLLTGEKVEGLYLVDCHMVHTDVEVPTACANAVVPAELMHRRLGHVGMGNLKIASRAVTGMGDVDWGAVARCEVCPLAKQTEEHFPRSTSRATRPITTRTTSGLDAYRVPVVTLDNRDDAHRPGLYGCRFCAKRDTTGKPLDRKRQAHTCQRSCARVFAVFSREHACFRYISAFPDTKTEAKHLARLYLVSITDALDTGCAYVQCCIHFRFKCVRCVLSHEH